MTKAQRTQIILDKAHGSKEEFTALHAILCMSHGWDTEDCIALDKLVDGVAIAGRLDEIINGWRREARAILKANA